MGLPLVVALNLMDEAEVAPLASARVIFCRNVFIYFSERAIRKTVKLFAARMPMPGYLFTSAAESLLKTTTDFVLEEVAHRLTMAGFEVVSMRAS
jgi:chemotaxis protein methyltransferase CheR